MKKTAIISLLFFSCLSCFSQNKSFQITDSAFEMMDSDRYLEGLRVWQNANNNYAIDPRNKQLFLDKAYKNHDTVNFKNTFKELISENGVQIDDFKGWGFYTNLISDSSLMKWYRSINPALYSKFLKENSEILFLIQEVKNFKYIDQQICIKQINNFKRENNNDSILNHKLDALAQEIAMGAFLRLIELCKKNNYLPNSFDHKHPEVTNNINLILLHNTKIAYKNKEKWEMIWPYLEKACLDGKYRPMDLLWYYDNSMYWNYGYQYYGTLLPQNVGHNNKIPIKDEQNVNQRRAKYGLLPL